MFARGRQSWRYSAYLEKFNPSLRASIVLTPVKDVPASRRLLELNQGVILAPEGGILADSPLIKAVPIRSQTPETVHLGLPQRRDQSGIETAAALFEIIISLFDTPIRKSMTFFYNVNVWIYTNRRKER